MFSISGAYVYDTTSGAEVSSNNTPQDFSDFVTPRSYRVVADTGEERIYKVVLYDLPVLVVNTPEGQPIISKEDRVGGCTLSLIDDEGVVNELGTAGVRGRGNSTWAQPKKPYNVKLDSKQSILGMESSKHWLLLSQPYYDRTQLHNITAFEMAHLTDYAWSESGAFVELILNDEHKGLYLLCEKIDVEKNKIDIKTDSDVDSTMQTCLLESFITGENPEYVVLPDYCFTTDYINATGPWWARRTMGWEIKYPDDISSEAKQGIIDRLNGVEKKLTDDKAVIEGLYHSSIDIYSFCDWWLIQEAAANMEASKSKNIYMYFDKDGLLKLGPPWDFDAYSFGQYGDRFTWLCKNDALYYKQLFKDHVFVECVKEKWSRYYPLWKKEIPSFIDNQYRFIHRSAERNEAMWPEWLELNHYPKVSYYELIQEMKDMFMAQLEWMNMEINTL